MNKLHSALLLVQNIGFEKFFTKEKQPAFQLLLEASKNLTDLELLPEELALVTFIEARVGEINKVKDKSKLN